MLVGCLLPGTGERLAGAAAVLGEEGADPAADTPCAGSQVRVVGGDCLGSARYCSISLIRPWCAMAKPCMSSAAA